MKIIKLFAIAILATASCSKSHHHKSHSDKSAIGNARPNEFWWPKKVNLNPLRTNNPNSSPHGDDFNYVAQFSTLDLKKVKKDINDVINTSQDWWPADFGNYGPFFIRLAWHSAGTYRTIDGKGGSDGGQIRFEPLNSWPDNANLDKARRLLWPIKKKYGNKLSWADLIILAGNVSLENMGFKTIGFAGGRLDDWESEIVDWGPEHKFLASKRHDKSGNLKKPLGATHMGLIYVNPEGPLGKPDPLASAKDIRETFARMAMNDEETVALIAGGHTFGKMHGAHKAEKCIGVEPAGAKIEEQGFGWKNKCGKGHGSDATTSGLEGAWTSSPTQWSMQYLENLFAFNWKKTKSPAGAIQWIPDDKNAQNLVPDAFDSEKRHAPVMLTTDLALKFDPEYQKIAKRFLANPKDFEDAFARAWFKLTHRDLGPTSRYAGSAVPKQQFVWQDPIVKYKGALINNNELVVLKKEILKSGLSVGELVKLAWASASTYRHTDMRGGANGARIRLEPQKNWQINNPLETAKALAIMEGVQKRFNNKSAKKISMADLIVVGGAAAIEKASLDAGYKITVPVKLGRGDATQEQTDVNSFSVLEPKADGFRNYYSKDSKIPPVEALIEKSKMLNLTIPEMTVLVGGLRVLGTNADLSQNGILTHNQQKLTNDFFVNLLDMSTMWEKSSNGEGIYVGKCRKTNQIKWLATPVDLVFGSNSELRAVAEYYAQDDNKKIFINDFVKAWNKVMNLDRFDLAK